MQTNKQYNLLAIIAGAFISLSAPVLAWAATASIEPAEVNTSVGKSFTVTVMFDSAQAFNAGEGAVTFDASKLSLTGVSKGSSFTIWQTEPRVGNPMSFAGGSTAALSGRQGVAKMTFKAKSEGSTEIKFDKATIVSMDTSADIADTKKSAAVTIGAGVAETPKTSDVAPAGEPAETSSGRGDLPEAPFINSKTNPKEGEYSGGNTVKFDWELPPDITAVAIDIDTASTSVPKTKFDPAIADKEFHNMIEGENFVHVRFKNSAGWGKIAHRKFLFDKTPPLPFTLTASSSPESTNAILLFSATDTLSGIARYDYSINGGAPKAISLVELKSGTYPISGLVNGSNGIKVSAYDRAGNKAEAEVAIMITAVTKTDGGGDGQVKVEATSGWAIVLAAVLALLAGVLGGTLWKERKMYKDERFVAKREVDEARDRVAVVFSALREEVRDRLGELSEKPNPSALDREVGKRMGDALDLSEELINKEVEDVRKLLSH